MRMPARHIETHWVPVAQVRFRPRRRGLSASTVERYRQWLEQGRQAPPVRLVRQGEWFLIRDGRHRVAAAIAAGFEHIEAEVGRIAAWALTGMRAAATAAVRILRSFHRGAAARVRRVHPRRAPGSWGLLPRKARYSQAREVEGSTPSGSIQASVVSTASTRPLYGRGAGSTPAGGSSSLAALGSRRAKPEALTKPVAGRSRSVISSAERPSGLRFDTAHPTAPHDRDDFTTAAGRNGSGYRLLIERTRVRIPPGASALR